MPWQSATKIVISDKVKSILEQLSKGTHTPGHLKLRSAIILKANEGMTNNGIETELEISPGKAKKWRDRFAQHAAELAKLEKEVPLSLRQGIILALSDAQRSGAPPKFTDVQVAAIIAMSCEKPEEYGVPFSHWTPEALRDKAIEKEIVDSISVRQVGRFLKERDLQPNLSKCWLNPNIEDMEQFQEQVEIVCKTYQEAAELEASGTHVYSTDEKTAIQAKEHANPSQPMKPGQVERVDPEYIKHGTTTLIASRNVATGEIVSPLIQQTRNEADFAQHIESITSDDEARYKIVADNLNTHKSETLVRLVARRCDIDEKTLGKKGKDGILKNMESRATFLADESHRIAFIYTPKHCSWLNQIECWFSVLTRRLLNKRSSFASVEDLEKKIKEFIDFYNIHMKKPFKWNFSGKLLKT